MNRYCRICWNTAHWKHPTKEAKYLELSDTYVSKHGFGHEEWLFNFNWLLSGYSDTDKQFYKYSFLQPISKYYEAYIGKTFSILLYTLSPDMVPLIVAEIKNAYIPNLKELAWVKEQYQKNGWLESMQQQVTNLSLSDALLKNPNPTEIANIRFLQEDVIFYEPMIQVPREHKIYSIRRYQPLLWNDGFQPAPTEPISTTPPFNPEDDYSFLRSEQERTRAAQMSSVYDPHHIKLQNNLFRYLCTRYGRESVLYEHGFVDLTIIEPHKVTFIEIKTSLTAKGCVRLAIGQLMEYAYFPNGEKVDVLLVVGDARPSSGERQYISHIRKKYGLPIYYARWSSEDNKLEEYV
ncbi:MAG: hypothetical protein AAC993_04855 [Dehalococcoides mccartyi]|uniref:hypothetical protein n=1 Tax=Dehalococcoides mccartyi TaxID=61435 RepID=UPI0030FCE0A0